jgi:hypothetical protein
MKAVPRLRRRHKYVDFTDLKEGEAYIKDDLLFIKVGLENSQYGFSVDGEDYHEDMNGVEVIPVNAEIHWSYKK